MRAASAAHSATRPGQLPQLAALLKRCPVVTPKCLCANLDLTILGAGKLLARAAGLGMVAEISGWQAWKVYLAADLASAFGFSEPPHGRPPSPPPALAPLDQALARFDRELAEINAKLGTLGTLGDEDDEEAPSA